MRGGDRFDYKRLVFFSTPSLLDGGFLLLPYGRLKGTLKEKRSEM